MFSARQAAGSAKGTVYPMLATKLCATLFLSQILSQHQFSSQPEGPQQFEDIFFTNKGALFSENNLSTNQHTKKRLLVLEKGEDRHSTNQSSQHPLKFEAKQDFHHKSSQHPLNFEGNKDSNHKSSQHPLKFEGNKDSNHKPSQHPLKFEGNKDFSNLFSQDLNRDLEKALSLEEVQDSNFFSQDFNRDLETALSLEEVQDKIFV